MHSLGIVQWNSTRRDHLRNPGGVSRSGPVIIEQSSQISPQVDSTTKKQRGGNFTSEEDIMIILAWLNIGLDVVQGNEQKSKTYWQRVCEYFHEYKPKSCPIRSQNSLMNRWSAIQLATNKFCGCFAQIERLNQSGLTEEDKV